MDDLIEALTILRKYGNPPFPTHCEHDQLRVFISPSAVPDEDKQRLDRLGFIPDSDGESFISYRFGSG